MSYSCECSPVRAPSGWSWRRTHPRRPSLCRCPRYADRRLSAGARNSPVSGAGKDTTMMRWKGLINDGIGVCYSAVVMAVLWWWLIFVVSGAGKETMMRWKGLTNDGICVCYRVVVMVVLWWWLIFVVSGAGKESMR